ncbi:uncharacterized protein LOC107669886 isoform X1 [Sinocyclocheilus anshuiensis]|uniref:uncharacterized protein LOC107669886 isoform X1 n=1 Tax=Sinocyclocheilus anshuiensis TaxID=1608454 RepID=UPI0007B9272D|nr:PREDICTED: uncharacterized protein LOC107669886 isoform X1 [Sinocyclocheilus anshuiensis]
MVKALLRGLIVLCLLHLCVQSIQGDVSPAALANMIQYFDVNVQPKADAQYAIAISVPQDQCTKEGAVIETVFSKEDAKYVKDVITKGEKCVLCTTSSNVIATRPNGTTKEHSEHILLYPLGNSPMDKLLKKTDQNSCVVFYSYNSPCVTKCIQNTDNILDGLSNWKNMRKEGMNVFVFENIWQKDAWRKDMEKDLLQINAEVPLYRCNRKNVMECQKCVEKNTGKVIPFCLPEKKSIFLYFQKMLLSVIKSWRVNE